jgi:hypothetical protein
MLDSFDARLDLLVAAIAHERPVGGQEHNRSAGLDYAWAMLGLSGRRERRSSWRRRSESGSPETKAALLHDWLL